MEKNLEKAVIHLEIILNHNIVFDAQFFLDFCNILRMFTPIRIFINKSFGFFRRFRQLNLYGFFQHGKNDIMKPVKVYVQLIVFVKIKCAVVMQEIKMYQFADTMCFQRLCLKKQPVDDPGGINLFSAFPHQ